MHSRKNYKINQLFLYTICKILKLTNFQYIQFFTNIEKFFSNICVYIHLNMIMLIYIYF